MTTLAARADWIIEGAYRRPVSNVASTDPEDYTSPHLYPQWAGLPATWRPAPTKAIVFDLAEDDCRLRVPITVTIDWGNGSFYVENEALGHYGVGDTVEEAVRDMFHSIRVIYTAYRNTPEELLDPGARDLLARHEHILGRAE